VSGTLLPLGFAPSSALKLLSTAASAAALPASNWATQTAISGHQVFARGIGSLPRASVAAYAEESIAPPSAGSGSLGSAASASGMYAAAAPGGYYGGGTVDSVAIAAATDAAAQELLAALGQLTAPE